MDYQEAIEIHIEECKHRIDVVNNFMNTNEDADKKRCYENINVLETAISAMQELQELHDQGISVERLKDIDFRKEVVEHINYDAYMSMQDELEEYKQLGTLEEVGEAVEKQTAKEPRATNRCYVCPHCGLVTSLRAKRNYCDACGQKILWKVEEWEKKSYQ